MQRIAAALCVSMSLLLFSCGKGAAPTTTTSPPIQSTRLDATETKPSPPSAAFPTTQTTPHAAVETEPAATATMMATAVTSVPAISNNETGLLELAVSKLLNASSFEMVAHEITAYQVIRANGETRQVYGEFNTNYAVIRTPMLKVHGSHEYRYDPKADFTAYDSYAYQQDGKYFSKVFENGIIPAAEEVGFQQIIPFASDVYQTLATYADQARLVTESDGMAVYVLEHPKWYVLEGAIGFADLGFLRAQKNGEQLVEQYAAEHYPNVETIVFTIYVAVDEKVITKVEVDNRDFMLSVWAEVNRALIAQGADAETLTQYIVMDENGSEYLFTDYNQVRDFEIPG